MSTAISEASVSSTTASRTPVSERAKAVIAQQRRLLKKFDSVAHLLGGIAAGMYLPGVDCTFDNPIRGFTGRRPVLLTLEVGDHGELSFTGAISRERNGLLNYTPIFNYDLTMPFTPKGGGKVLPANNVVLARRANELLGRLVSFARGLEDSEADSAGWLDVLQLPEPLRDENGVLYAEDYRPVLGFTVPNPAAQLNTVLAVFANPAAKILARAGMEAVNEDIGQTLLDELATQFRAEFSVPAADDVVYDALLTPAQRISLPLELSEAIKHAPSSVVAAMRAALPAKHQWAATYAELLTAAEHPEKPLRLCRLSAIQVFDVVDALNLPDAFSGYVLRRPEMTPQDSALAQVHV